MKSISLVGLCAQKLFETAHPNVIFEILTNEYVQVIVKTSQCSQQFVIPLNEVGIICFDCGKLVTHNNFEMHENSDEHNYMCYISFDTIQCTYCEQEFMANNQTDIAVHNFECVQQLDFSKEVNYCNYCRMQIKISDLAKHVQSVFHKHRLLR